MPNNTSANKRMRQNMKRRARNKFYRSTVRSTIKAFETAVKEGEKETATTKYGEMVKMIDTAAGKGFFHKNTAARKKSRMYRKLKDM